MLFNSTLGGVGERVGSQSPAMARNKRGSRAADHWSSSGISSPARQTSPVISMLKVKVVFLSVLLVLVPCKTDPAFNHLNVRAFRHRDALDEIHV